ncbi:AAA family ATPase [Halosolutus gelatinilyticus]|uniref:AAA family ATPase n=1 Tax=Halosolutus gelatinilyticus TaxID=2931975 RepID=UPI001FF0F4B8|nr:MoxR family ATPase [Halosolutus gelatinilyticus]
MSETDRTDDRGDPQAIYEAVRNEVDRVLVGNEAAIEHLTIALLTRGHLLIEGVPGVAKTTIASLFARATGLEFTRIQMTPDILPADITGTHVYHEDAGEFDLRRGPVFSNLVVADEINRATPKTQSALLEAMQERTVTIEGETLSLPEPFMVVATQNPIEMEGVFELPEAQRDRFMFRLAIDLPDRAVESKLLDRFDSEPDLGPDDIGRPVAVDDILAARETAMAVHVADPVKAYILDLVGATRSHPDVTVGASPRASLAFLDGVKARAAVRGRAYAIPDDAKALAPQILAHRLVLSTDADLGNVAPDDVVSAVLESVDVPDADIDELESIAGETA